MVLWHSAEAEGLAIITEPIEAEQPHLSATVQARRLSLFGHTAWMSDESDAKQILTASPFENWRPLGRRCTTWMKTTQQDLESLNSAHARELNPQSVGHMSDTLTKCFSTFSLKRNHLQQFWLPTELMGVARNLDCTLNEAIDVAQNRPLWRMVSMFDATHS